MLNIWWVTTSSCSCQGCIAACERFDRLQNTKNSQSVSSSRFSRKAEVHIHGKGLRSSHTGQVVVTLSISDASPPLFTCIKLKRSVSPGQWTDFAFIFPLCMVGTEVEVVSLVLFHRFSQICCLFVTNCFSLFFLGCEKCLGTGFRIKDDFPFVAGIEQHQLSTFL